MSAHYNPRCTCEPCTAERQRREKLQAALKLSRNASLYLQQAYDSLKEAEIVAPSGAERDHFVEAQKRITEVYSYLRIRGLC